MTHRLQMIIGLATAALMSGCGGSSAPPGALAPTSTPSAAPTASAVVATPTATPESGDRQVFAIATDFDTGSFATVALDDRGVSPVSAQRRVHSDAVPRVFGGLVYVVNRFGADNIQVLDPGRDFETRFQCSTGNGSNPHDIAFVDAQKAYVSLYQETDLLIVNPSAASDCSDFVLGRVDLSAFADKDGIPEMDQMAIVGGKLYVALQHLDRNNFFQPAEAGEIAIVDVATDAVEGSITLSGTNPVESTKGLPVSGDSLVLGETGSFGVNDGGIERVDLGSGQAQGFFITDADLGGDITDFALVSDRLGYAVVSLPDFTSALVSFDPLDRTSRVIAGSDFLSDIELDDRGEIYAADRTLTAPGLRVFRTEDGAELTPAPLPLGLPPFELVFLK